MSEYPWNKKNETFTWLSSLYNPFKGSAVTLWSFPSDLNSFWNFFECEVVGINVEVILSSWNFLCVKNWIGVEEFFQPFHLTNQRIRTVVHISLVYWRRRCFGTLSIQLFTILKSSLFHFYYWLRQILHTFVQFCWFRHSQVLYLLVRRYFSIYRRFQDYSGFGIFWYALSRYLGLVCIFLFPWERVWWCLNESSF